MRVALVYDRVNKFGGAERVLLALHKIWPQAPLFTAVYDPQGAPWAKDFRVYPSFVQKIPFAKSRHELYPWLMPFAFESFDFSAFDVVISITSAEAKGLITQPKVLHLCYCLTPTRYLWSSFKHYVKNPRYGILNPLAKIMMKSMLERLRQWDKVACQRPDYYFSISQTVKKRIKKYYGRDSEIIYPPVDTDKFRLKKEKLPARILPVAGSDAAGKITAQNLKVNKEKEYFLVVSRLVSYKRVNIIIDSFNKLGWSLKIIGDGSEKHILQKKAKPNIEFLGQELTDNKLLSYYQGCLALVFAGEEDFGLVSLEAQACGKPVIAFKQGGVGETVINGKTGILFSSQTSRALIKALKGFRAEKFRAEDCRQNAKKFNEKIFLIKFKKLVEDKWEKHKKLT
ncbi:MAG TPA: glycosyltransferase [Candidatus Bathyarchaeia archaeon]|nr:glycosyltransferase [Candidatus Bathyarchaeia archaeon]